MRFCEVKSRFAELVCDRPRGSPIEQESHCLDMVLPDCLMQRRIAQFSRSIYVSASFHQRDDLFHYSSATRYMEWSLAENTDLIHILQFDSSECGQVFFFVAAQHSAAVSRW